MQNATYKLLLNVLLLWLEFGAEKLFLELL